MNVKGKGEEGAKHGPKELKKTAKPACKKEGKRETKGGKREGDDDVLTSTQREGVTSWVLHNQTVKWMLPHYRRLP